MAEICTFITLINEGSGTNEGPGIFVTLYNEAFENSQLKKILDPHPPRIDDRPNKKGLF